MRDQARLFELLMGGVKEMTVSKVQAGPLWPSCMIIIKMTSGTAVKDKEPQ